MDKIVLIVDDDEMSARVLGHHLERAGWNVLYARDGYGALDVLSTNAAPIVITDRDMPEMDGLELCRVLRGCEAFGVLYIMMITGGDSADNCIIEAIDAGADDFITKPFNERVLLARVRAGQRVVELHNELHEKTREIFRSNAETEVAYRKAEEANRQLTILSQTDALTGVRNRRAAMDDLDQQWSLAERHETPLSCIALDIDHFKSINDSYGHAVGDQVLIAVAGALERASRTSDRMYRIGGEEFLVVCPQTDLEAAATAAERMRADIERLQIEISEGVINVTASFGVADVASGARSPDHLLRRADEALYAAKNDGRNCVMKPPAADSPAEAA